MNNQDNVILGINIYKKSFDVALLLFNGKRKDKKFANQYDGFDELQAWLMEKGWGSI